MLGWFKKKFSKKKKQEMSLEQESVPDQEKVGVREEEEPVKAPVVDDGKETSVQDHLISELVEEYPGTEPEEGIQEDIPATSPVIENRQDGVKETVSPEEGEASPEPTPTPEPAAVEEPAGVTAETEDEPGSLPDDKVLPTEEQPSAEQEHSGSEKEIFPEEEKEGNGEETTIIGVDEAPAAFAPGKEETAAEEDGSPEQVDLGCGRQEKTDLHESPVLTNDNSQENSEEETLEETLTELIADADEKTDLLEEPTSEADLGIIDQTLEELLAPDQPEDEDFGTTEAISDEESATGEQEDLESGEGRLQEEAAEPEGTAETGEEQRVIVDQPLEELLADEQPDEVSALEEDSLEEDATDFLDQEKEQQEEEKEPQPIEETVVASVTADKPTRKSLFQRLQERLGKTRQGLLYRLDSIFLGKKEIDEDLLDELEEILITSDLGVATTMDLLDAARRQVKRKELSDPQALKKILRDKILGYLLASDQPAELVLPESGPFVIMVVGVNGVGKTTTIGKIANKFEESGQSVLLIAADTFRAAAIDQLKIWAGRVGTEIIAHKPGADPSSVVFDGLDYGVSNDFDAIIIDTAGRLHTSVNLMEELKKIRRVIAKKMPGAPHEVLLVLDATTGQNGISQAKLFGEAVGVSGLALTKLDGTAKGGIVANVCRELKIPVRFIGIGEQMDDLRDFDAHEFVDALFAEETGALESSTAA